MYKSLLIQQKITFLFLAGMAISALTVKAQSRKLTPENINRAIREASAKLSKDPFRPAFHLTPPAGCMGDPNGGIFYQGWYHIFYGLQPFGPHPGGWYWAHARSRDLLHWEHMKPDLTPAFDLDLNAVGSGSTIITGDGKKLAFYSESKGGRMQFWQAQFTNDELSEWIHKGKNPILSLEQPGIPDFDAFWRDPYVFRTGGRTFLIACADLFEEDYVPVPIFEAKNDNLTEWDYKGSLFTVPKHRYRNLEVPQFVQLGEKWLFMASTDAPVDRTNYFLGKFDLENLTFTPEQEGPLDYSGHYYAQESLTDDHGDVYLLAWIPGWDREWLPTYMNEPLKNSNPLWNGNFSLPRRLSLENGKLLQRPVESLKQLRSEHITLDPRELPVSGPVTEQYVIDEFQGDQLEIQAEFDLKYAAFCGLNVLCDEKGSGGLYIVWSGDMLNVDGVKVPLNDWQPGKFLQLRIFIDKKIVEVFVNDGRYCISRQVREENVKGKNVALTSLGGTARLVSLEVWKLKTLH